MNNNDLKFEQQTDTKYVAKIYKGIYSRFYHIDDYGTYAILQIFGSNRKPGVRYRSVKRAMRVAKEEHNRWLSSIKKEAKV